MNVKTYFVKFAGSYYLKEKSNFIFFNVEGKEFKIKSNQIVYWEPIKNEKDTQSKEQDIEFLIAITEEQLQFLKATSKTEIDYRIRYGTGSLPPRGGKPPPIIEILRMNVRRI
jgi:hypothetical protein